MSVSALSNASALAVLQALAQSTATQSGAKSSSSETSASPQSILTGLWTSDSNAAVKAIQAIVTRAQIEQAQAKQAAGVQQAFEETQTQIVSEGSTTTVNAQAAYVETSASDIPPDTFWSDPAQQMADVAQFTQSLLEPSGEPLPFSVSAQVVSTENSAQTPEGSTSVAAEMVQAQVGTGATDPWGAGLTVSVIADAASAADSGSASSLTSASATFLASGAYQQLASGGGAAISAAETAYAAQAGVSSSIGGANVTLSLPDTAQQIAYAVTEVDAKNIWTEYNGPVVAATAADAVNVTMANGTMTATQGGSLPEGLPSLANIQQAISQLAISSPQSYPATAGLATAAYEGSLTLVKLPPDALYACGDNFTVFSTGSQWNFDTDDKWALVLPQDTVTMTVSQTQTASDTQTNG